MGQKAWQQVLVRVIPSAPPISRAPGLNGHQSLISKRIQLAIRYFSQERTAVLERLGTTWVQLTVSLLGLSESSSLQEVENAVRQKIEAFVTDKEDVDRVLSGLRWIGLFDPTPVGGYGMAYQPGERDMIVLQHIFDIKHADGSVENGLSTLVEYGEPLGLGSRSAMAKLV